jgi:O-acetyl-ADP-ribose deacetylase (regulator of RNase III)
MIKTIKGNLLENVKHGVIVQGCNAQGVMGSGIALQIKQKYPLAFRLYLEQYNLNKSLELGRIVVAPVKISNDSTTNLYVINGITQQFYGRDGKRYVDYDAVKSVFEKVNQFALEKNIRDIHFPLIGAGLGGGDWSIIEKLIDDSLDEKLNKNLWVL